MRCPTCGSESAPGKRFCADCGASLLLRCPKCNAEAQPGKSFCADCGAPLDAPSLPRKERSLPRSEGLVRVAGESSEVLEGERKTVTALFADIKGSMELIEDLDPEEARAIVEPALKLMMEAVHRYDGYVAQSTGDGIFALFGAPVAHEDHPQRALYAALRMQEELKRYSDRIRAEGRLPMQGRVGVNTGEMVVRLLQTGAAQTEYVPIGHSTSLAARMQALAPIGSIATTAAVRRLCEGYFVFKDLGPTRVKGVSELINVFEVTGLGPLRTRLQRSARRGLTKFVGREREMAALKAAAEQARAGHGQIVAAMAEAGAGKSRLFFEFKAVSQSGWMVLETFSVSHGKASAYLPVIDLLHGYFGIDAGDDSRKRREKVAGKIAVLDRALEDALPYLFGLLGIVQGDDPLAQMDEHVQKRRTLEAIKRILLRESLNQPLMVIFEDLHWIDEQTQEFLNLLADSIGTAKLLLLVNYRPGYSHQWNSKTYYTQVRLDPLGRESAGEMLAALLGDGDDLAALKRLIIEQTEGTPFFMEETVQVLLDEGALVRNGTVKLTRPLAEVKIPSTVQAILAARIDWLPPDAKELLQVLAVIGRDFPLALIRALITKSDDELDRLLNDLQLGEFIYEQPAVGGTEYIFKHALTQEVAYNSVLMERRKALHERIGGALEALYASSLDDHLVELAHHYGRSANFDAAVQYLTHAGKQKMEEARRVERRLADIPSEDAHGNKRMLAEDEVATVPALQPAREKKTATAGELAAVLDCVDAIWRYPIKSMAGEELPAVEMTARGLLGDRIYALVDKASNRTAVVRSWAAALLTHRSQFVTEPQPGAPVPDVRITLPSGLTLTTSDPDIDERFSAVFGRSLTLMATAPAGLLIEFPAGTLGGALSNATEVPVAGGAPPGAFFDYGCVHLIATSTLDHLQKAYPEGRFDVRRFRPNIVIRSQREPFIENSWVGGMLAIGDEVVLRITIPCPRCVNMILPQGDLPHDPGILHTVAQLNMRDVGNFGTLPCAGVYADVVKPGTIRRGDTVHYLGAWADDPVVATGRADQVIE
jgi:class 3 adenylate cyclase/uncharacterized protein YcbX